MSISSKSMITMALYMDIILYFSKYMFMVVILSKLWYALQNRTCANNLFDNVLRDALTSKTDPLL